MHSLGPFGVVIVCGFLYGRCFAPARLHLLAWVVLVPALVVMRRARPPRAALLAAILALAGTAATVDWLPHTVTVYFGQPRLGGLGLLAAVALVMVVPPYTVFGLWYSAARPGPLLPLQAAAVWVAQEFVRANTLGGNPWVLFGYSQAAVVPVIQVADLTGVYGVSFVLAAVNVALAELWLALRDRGRPLRPALVGIAMAVLTLASVLLYGWQRMARFAARADAEPTSAVLVQGNLDLGSQWRQDLYGRNLDTYLQLTAAALRRQPAELVIWPENAMTFFLEQEPLYQAALGSVLSHWQAQLVAGGPHTWDQAQPKFYNSAFTIAPDGQVLGRYDKQVLLPFAEYFPLPQLDILRRDFGRVREFTPGPARPPLPTVAGPAGVLICNEVMFPEVARQRVVAGAAYLLNLSNDTWVNDPRFATMAFDMSVFRAVEQRRDLVRVSTSGPSALVDPLGRVVVQTDLFVAQTRHATIGGRAERSIYSQLGDAFALACVAMALGSVARRPRGTTRQAAR
jgi:apolipoprotein N-acyltransferase